MHTPIVPGSILKLRPVDYNFPSDTSHSQKFFSSLKRLGVDCRGYQTTARKEENQMTKSSKVLPHYGAFLQLVENKKLQKETEVNKDISQGPNLGMEIHKKQGTTELTFISLTTSHMYTNS